MPRCNIPLAPFELAKKEVLKKALEANNWKVGAAARELKVTQPTAYRLALRYGLMKRAKIKVERNRYVKA